MILDRIKEAGKTQAILSKHASVISSRLGFHELSDEICSRVGFIILQLSGTSDKFDALETDLRQIEGIETKSMSFNF